MKISFENPDKVNGLMTISVEEEDYKENVEKKLKEYRIIVGGLILIWLLMGNSLEMV